MENSLKVDRKLFQIFAPFDEQHSLSKCPTSVWHFTATCNGGSCTNGTSSPQFELKGNRVHAKSDNIFNNLIRGKGQIKHILPLLLTFGL